VTAEQPAVRVITDEPLVHRDTCLNPNPVLVYSGGWICCAHCAVRVPGRVELVSDGAQP
jgi:hypothetical protein